jgi:hypothetical protein
MATQIGVSPMMYQIMARTPCASPWPRLLIRIGTASTPSEPMTPTPVIIPNSRERSL